MPNSNTLPNDNFTNSDIQALLSKLDEYSAEEMADITSIVDELAVREQKQKSYDDLIEFCD